MIYSKFIPAEDRLKLILNPGVLGLRLFRLVECSIVEHVLPLWYKAYPEDDRIRRAIDVARLYNNGRVGIDELDVVRAGVCIDANKLPPTASAEDDALTGWSTAKSAGMVLSAAEMLTTVYLMQTNYYISSACYSAVLSDMTAKILKRDGLNWRACSEAEAERVYRESEAAARSELEWQAETMSRLMEEEGWPDCK